MSRARPNSSRRSLEISSEDSSSIIAARYELPTKVCGDCACNPGRQVLLLLQRRKEDWVIHNGQAVELHRLQRHHCRLDRKEVRPRCGSGKFESRSQLDTILKLLVECEAPTWPHYFCLGCECGCVRQTTRVQCPQIGERIG
jgi:hypothetical protein